MTLWYYLIDQLILNLVLQSVFKLHDVKNPSLHLGNPSLHPRMPRKVKAQREAAEARKNKGLITQFVIFVILRVIDHTSCFAVLHDAWKLNTTSTWNASAKRSHEKLADVNDNECVSGWLKKDVESEIRKYNTILVLTVFFNTVSCVVFLIHFSFWIKTLKIFSNDVNGYDTVVKRLFRSSLMSLASAVIRDIPLSCLNTELLVLRSGRAGLVCRACSFSKSCSPQAYVVTSLTLSRQLLYYSYSTMLLNSQWKAVSGFYRLSRIKDFEIHIIRACASIVFAFIYCATTFTPAMLVLIYRYFAIPNQNLEFLHQIAAKVVVVGGVVWVIGGSAVLCCPILNAIKLTVD